MFYLLKGDYTPPPHAALPAKADKAPAKQEQVQRETHPSNKGKRGACQPRTRSIVLQSVGQQKCNAKSRRQEQCESSTAAWAAFFSLSSLSERVCLGGSSSRPPGLGRRLPQGVIRFQRDPQQRPSHPPQAL